MLLLTRFFRKNWSPIPSYMYFAYQKHVNKFFSIGNDGDTEISTVPKDSTYLEMTDRVIEKRCLNGKNSDSVILQPTSKDKAMLRQLLKGSKGKRRQYIMDTSVAETLVTYLKKDLRDSDIIVESSPGLGLLTETILTETNNEVVAYEPNNNLRSNLQKSLLPQYSGRLQIQSHDFEKFYAYYIIDQREPEKPILENFLQPMLRKEGSEFLPIKIVGAIYDEKIIATLVLSYTFQSSIYGEISPVLYIYIPFSMYRKIVHGPNYVFNSYGIHFQYYFDVDTLQVVPKESFYPIRTTLKKRKCDSNDDIYLVKISPRKEFFQDVPQSELESFHFFIHTVSRIKRADSLIIGMERWIPDCGPELIKNGFHVFAHPRELTPEQLLQAYKIFISLPSYQESTFHYQRQQFVARFGERDEKMLENKSADEAIDLDDHKFLESELTQV